MVIKEPDKNEKNDKPIPLENNDDYAITVDSVKFNSPLLAINSHGINHLGVNSERSFSSEILSNTIENEYKYGKFGLLIGVVAMIGGIFLGIYGVVGSTSWSAKFAGFESSLVDASPGVILFVIGLFIMLFTRPKVNFKNLNW